MTEQQDHYDTLAQKQADRLDAEHPEPAVIIQSLRYSGSVGDLRTALAKASLEFESIHKDKKGQKGHQTFKYAPMHKLVEATRPALARHGIWVEQHLHSDTEGPWTLTMVVSLGDQSIISEFSLVPEEDSQELGKQTTYLRRYQYNCFFQLDAVDDADNDEEATRSGASQGASRPPSSHRGQRSSGSSKPPQGQQRAPVCNADTMATVKKSLRSAGLHTRGEVREWAALQAGLHKPIDEWTTAEAEKVITQLVAVQSAQAKAESEVKS